MAKKIACLRTCYARELKKLIEFQEKAKLADDFEFTYKPKWQFFEMLDPYLRPSVLQNSSYFNNMVGRGSSACCTKLFLNCFVLNLLHTCRPIKMNILSKLFYKIISCSLAFSSNS